MISARMLTSIYESRTGSFSAIARSVMISANILMSNEDRSLCFSAIARSVMISASFKIQVVHKRDNVSVL